MAIARRAHVRGIVMDIAAVAGDAQPVMPIKHRDAMSIARRAR
jgi:hypothetical protein